MTWKVEVTNTDTKDHTLDLQVRFYDEKSEELFHDSVMRNKVAAGGTLTVTHTATVDAKKGRGIQSTQTFFRVRR